MENNFEENQDKLNPNEGDFTPEDALKEYYNPTELSDKLPPRILIDGVPEYVQAAIDELEEIGFAKASDWSSPLPSDKEGEVVRILFNPKCVQS
jgi:hypothetical protein